MNVGESQYEKHAGQVNSPSWGVVLTLSPKPRTPNSGDLNIGVVGGCKVLGACSGWSEGVRFWELALVFACKEF